MHYKYNKIRYEKDMHLVFLSLPMFILVFASWFMSNKSNHIIVELSGALLSFLYQCYKIYHNKKLRNHFLSNLKQWSSEMAGLIFTVALNVFCILFFNLEKLEDTKTLTSTTKT